MKRRASPSPDSHRRAPSQRIVTPEKDIVSLSSTSVSSVSSRDETSPLHDVIDLQSIPLPPTPLPLPSDTQSDDASTYSLNHNTNSLQQHDIPRSQDQRRSFSYSGPEQSLLNHYPLANPSAQSFHSGEYYGLQYQQPQPFYDHGYPPSQPDASASQISSYDQGGYSHYSHGDIHYHFPPYTLSRSSTTTAAVQWDDGYGQQIWTSPAASEAFRK